MEGCFLGADARMAKKPARQQRLHLTDWVRHVVCVVRGPNCPSARRRTSPYLAGLQPGCALDNDYSDAWSANTTRLWQNTPSPTVLAKPLKPRKTQRHQRNARFKPEIVPSRVRDRGDRREGSPFLPVGIPFSVGGPIEVVHPRGHVIRVPAIFDAAALGHILAAIDAPAGASGGQ